MRKEQKASVLAERARLNRARRGGPRDPGSSEVPFGIAALESGISIPGVERSQPGTPATGTSFTEVAQPSTWVPPETPTSGPSMRRRLFEYLKRIFQRRTSTEPRDTDDGEYDNGPVDLGVGERACVGVAVERDSRQYLNPDTDPIARAVGGPYNVGEAGAS